MEKRRNKVLLLLAPFWPPLSPPMGISCLSGYLKKHGYDAFAIDMNGDDALWCYHNNYLKMLHSIVPKDKQGNIDMTGFEVFINHLRLYLAKRNNEQYFMMVEEIYRAVFFDNISKKDIIFLTEIVQDYLFMFKKKILQLISTHKPDVVGFSLFNGSMASSLYACELIKKYFPEILTIVGGGIFSGQLTQGNYNFNMFIEEAKDIDHILIGEGERLLLYLLDGRFDDTKKVISLEDIKFDLLDLCHPSYFDFESYNMDNYIQLPIYASRGCPFQCSFCCETVNWIRYRKRKVEQVVDDMENLYKSYKKHLYFFTDSLINPIVNEISNLIIERELPLYWDSYLRVSNETCQMNLVSLWRQGGMYRSRLGVESGSQIVLDEMNKNITVDQIRETIKNLANAGIKTTTYWVIGHPGETEEEFQKTLDLIYDLKDYIYEADCNPFNFYMGGQSNSDNWFSKNKATGIYSDECARMLLSQTWQLDIASERRVTYERINRFMSLCKELQIANPYSIQQIHQADSRWKSLWPNAVPMNMELNERFLEKNTQCDAYRFSLKRGDQYEKEREEAY
ncbi:radical SAM protein [Tissierella carlieri]|uniref:B12-binding domain-containing radical SAM protein n=1 Tax=Tissierella carlieri TaxID=689904 RepID=A0ABT1S5J7_9FIRM|nr:radical SAM protein [Tissierella carlieri]MCQ4921645.1 B12-binding domain-containing radical SAM protein [Tissierella carlieri]